MNPSIIILFSPFVYIFHPHGGSHSQPLPWPHQLTLFYTMWNYSQAYRMFGLFFFQKEGGGWLSHCCQIKKPIFFSGKKSSMLFQFLPWLVLSSLQRLICPNTLGLLINKGKKRVGGALSDVTYGKWTLHIVKERPKIIARDSSRKIGGL